MERGCQRFRAPPPCPLRARAPAPRGAPRPRGSVRRSDCTPLARATRGPRMAPRVRRSRRPRRTTRRIARTLVTMWPPTLAPRGRDRRPARAGKTSLSPRDGRCRGRGTVQPRRVTVRHAPPSARVASRHPSRPSPSPMPTALAASAIRRPGSSAPQRHSSGGSTAPIRGDADRAAPQRREPRLPAVRSAAPSPGWPCTTAA